MIRKPRFSDKSFFAVAQKVLRLHLAVSPTDSISSTHRIWTKHTSEPRFGHKSTRFAREALATPIRILTESAQALSCSLTKRTPFRGALLFVREPRIEQPSLAITRCDFGTPRFRFLRHGKTHVFPTPFLVRILARSKNKKMTGLLSSFCFHVREPRFELGTARVSVECSTS